MRVVLRHVTLLVLLSAMSAGCVTYSPFLSMPSEPMRRGRGEVGAAVSALTRTGQSASVESGIEGNVRYGFTNTFSLGFRMWTTDFEWTDGASVNGVSFDGLFNLNDSASAVRYAIASRALFLFSDRTLEGQGLLVDGVAWLPDFRVFKPFVAVGGGVGEDLDPDPEDREFIVVATGHAGIALNLTDNLYARLEGASVTEFNAPENGKGVRWWIVPSLSLAWRF